MRLPGLLLVSAPLCIAGYGVIRLAGRADGHYGPGSDWQAAHLFGLLGMVLFIPVVRNLAAELPPSRPRTGIVVATLIGLAATIVQFTADISFAALADTKADMSRLSHQFSDIPGVRSAFYTVGPRLFFLGLIVLVCMLAWRKALPKWSPPLLLAGILLSAFSLDFLPLTGAAILLALLPLAERDVLGRMRLRVGR
ncbi:hypothetical protein [Nocardia goodfellowii]|uniref:Drug/metabolite transporter (DMT)-like permease n=1 Tax=Nocardia goodfellowii TaxID=882446 RepID=A0ABS4QBH3_9NOCA|nr:hypothetical protein [Nocardia goodfellowii]MBP2189040.1 drug/metabolite transporter (DMT)-like permease [Nocardia goodfellowii]